MVEAPAPVKTVMAMVEQPKKRPGADWYAVTDMQLQGLKHGAVVDIRVPGDSHVYLGWYVSPLWQRPIQWWRGYGWVKLT